MPRLVGNGEHLDASLESRIRGLMLGLCMGDAVGSQNGVVAPQGALKAGAASQLAAWSVEGTLRNLTRYGQLHPHLAEIGLYAYQRWGLLRGLEPVNRHNWHPRVSAGDGTVEDRGGGWLIGDPAMRVVRGSSPTTEKALYLGKAVRSSGCQAMLRVLPTAALAHIGYDYFGAGGVPNKQGARSVALDWARNLALLTHDDGQRQDASALAVGVMVEVLSTTDNVERAVRHAIADADHPVADCVQRALTSGSRGLQDLRILLALAPDKTSWSALAGGLYVALSFPDEGSIQDALTFASRAPDGDSVAAVAGAVLGARHGFEALPLNWLGRLELGWVADRLARDLAAEMRERQGGGAWRDDAGGRRVLDAWWDVKYPGV